MQHTVCGKQQGQNAACVAAVRAGRLRQRAESKIYKDISNKFVVFDTKDCILKMIEHRDLSQLANRAVQKA